MPDDRAEAEDLGRMARGIVHRRLGPANDIAPIIHLGREAVIAAEGRHRGHMAVAPQKAAADVAGNARKECRAAPVLAERAQLRRLGDTDDHVAVVETWPLDL